MEGEIGKYPLAKHPRALLKNLAQLQHRWVQPGFGGGWPSQTERGGGGQSVVVVFSPPLADHVPKEPHALADVPRLQGPKSDLLLSKSILISAYFYRGKNVCASTLFDSVPSQAKNQNWYSYLYRFPACSALKGKV